MKELKRGAKGAEVRALQRALNDRSSARGLPRVRVDGTLTNTDLRAVLRVGRALGVLESTLAKGHPDRKAPVVTVGLQRIIRHPTTRTPAQLARARSRARKAPEQATQIIGRETWGARSPRGSYSRLGTPQRAVIHHTAALASMFRSPAMERLHMRTIQGWHFARGFTDIGYHRVTFPSGRTYAGRPLSALGAGVAGHNTGSVHYCLAGNFEVEKPTPEALSAVPRVRRMDRTHGLPTVGHFQLQANACPGRNVKPHIRSL